MNWRRLLPALGVGVLVAVTVVSLVLPELVAVVAPSWLVPPPESRSEAAATVLVPVAALALVAAGYAALWLLPTRSTTPGLDRSVEVGASDAVDTVGRRFRQERAWSAHDWAEPGLASRTLDFRERLQEAAADALVLSTGVDRETAAQSVAEGTWTDDPVAAWYLAPEDADVRLPATTWLRAKLLPVSTYRDVVDRTAEAVDDVRGDP